MSKYYNTTIYNCKWREPGVFLGEQYVTCHNPDAIKAMDNGGDCFFHRNNKADTCDYFERKASVNQKFTKEGKE